MNLTKRNIVIALLINAALMGISHRMGYCLDYALPCSLIWGAIMAYFYFASPRQKHEATE